MSDLVVVDVGERRVAIAAQHARELASAGWVTPVPTAPALVAGLRSLRAFFLDEAGEHLDQATADLARLRARPHDGEVVTALLRALHTLKGSAGSVELPDVARAAHAIEDRLVALRAAPSAVGLPE